MGNTVGGELAVADQLFICAEQGAHLHMFMGEDFVLDYPEGYSRSVVTNVKPGVFMVWDNLAETGVDLDEPEENVLRGWFEDGA